jgi:hypothetical protein
MTAQRRHDLFGFKHCRSFAAEQLPVPNGETRPCSSSMPKRKIASLLGLECDEVIHSILDVMYANAPYTLIQRAMHIHPTVAELIPTMLGELTPSKVNSSSSLLSICLDQVARWANQLLFTQLSRTCDLTFDAVRIGKIYTPVFASGREAGGPGLATASAGS